MIAWALAVLVAAILTQSHADELSVGDPTRGETIYRKCQGCHSIDRNRVAKQAFDALQQSDRDDAANAAAVEA